MKFKKDSSLVENWKTPAYLVQSDRDGRSSKNITALNFYNFDIKSLNYTVSYISAKELHGLKQKNRDKSRFLNWSNKLVSLINAYNCRLVIQVNNLRLSQVHAHHPLYLEKLFPDEPTLLCL